MAMSKPITRNELRELMESQQVQLLDVLPEAEYSESHLPGAVNLPLKDLGPESVMGLDQSAPTVVY